ncbi:F-box only protein 47-like isoform X3 [Takifugu flavidus]|uniref:F-box only protein 47-like isoform X3 n=1 Tax=Takifugu flavidus TaxID=433684 RepID=UPI00254471CB|nr:F-box only protein 47-like isoform X3 [Takifugu flavidus]
METSPTRTDKRHRHSRVVLNRSTGKGNLDYIVDYNGSSYTLSAVAVMVKKTSKRNARSFTDCFKLRRTPLQRRPARTIVTRSQSHVRGGLFRRLPSELFDMILDQMSGLLFKRCTLLLPTKERLKFIFSKISQIPCFSMDQCELPGCLGLSCYGVFFQTLIAGWDRLECHRVFNFLCELTHLLKNIEAVLSERPGLKRYQERQIRLYCRHVLLDCWPNQPVKKFWLNLLLNPWPLVSQARLLFILYGPSCPDGTLNWHSLVEMELPRRSLWEVANAIHLLFGDTDLEDQSNQSMLTILEELIVVPQQWHVDNVARLLVLCESSLCYNILASKAINGRLFEVSRLLVHIVLVCEEDNYHVSWAVKLVHRIYNLLRTAAEKFRFIQQLESMFSMVTMEMLEFSVTGNNVGDRETLQSLHFFLNSTARFHAKLLQMFVR